MNTYRKVIVQHVSLNLYEDDGEGFAVSPLAIEDSGISEIIGKSDQDFLYSCLTRRQRRVAELLQEGYSRVEVGQDLGVCTQAIHQIVLRIRKRLMQKAAVSLTRQGIYGTGYENQQVA
jgi:DNA-binding CsgD family transcriptional regulator